MGSQALTILEAVQTGLATLSVAVGPQDGTATRLLLVLRGDPLTVDPNTAPIAVAYYDHTQESRKGYGGALNQGTKMRDYDLCVLLRDATDDVNEWQAASDRWYGLVEQVCGWLRGHQTLDATGPTIQGPAQASGETIEIMWERPQHIGGITRFGCVIRTPIREEFSG